MSVLRENIKPCTGHYKETDMEETKNTEESLLPSARSILKNVLIRIWSDIKSKEEIEQHLIDGDYEGSEIAIKEAMELTRDKTAEHIIKNCHWFTSGIEYLESLKTSDKLKVH